MESAIPSHSKGWGIFAEKRMKTMKKNNEDNENNEDENILSNGYPRFIFGSLSSFDELGEILRAYQLMDVVFIWSKDKLVKYDGISLGWEFSCIIDEYKNKEDALYYAENWLTIRKG